MKKMMIVMAMVILVVGCTTINPPVKACKFAVGVAVKASLEKGEMK